VTSVVDFQPNGWVVDPCSTQDDTLKS
jgi:hypothetical protein